MRRASWRSVARMWRPPEGDDPLALVPSRKASILASVGLAAISSMAAFKGCTPRKSTGFSPCG